MPEEDESDNARSRRLLETRVEEALSNATAQLEQIQDAILVAARADLQHAMER